MPITHQLESAERDLVGRRVRVLSGSGDQPPVLLLGGCGVSSTYWTKVAAELTGRRLLVLDRPGLGGTVWPRRIPTLAEEVDTLVALLTGERPAVVVAHSMAAFHAEALARQHPDLVGALIMVDGSVEWPTHAPGTPSPRVADAIYWVAGSPLARGLGAVSYRLGASFQSFDTGHVRRHDDFRLDYDDRNALAMAVGEAIAYQGQAWELMGVRERYALPDRPAAVLTAAQSHERDWMPRQRRYARFLHASQVVADDCKHLMMIDRPRLVVEAVQQLSRRVAG